MLIIVLNLLLNEKFEYLNIAEIITHQIEANFQTPLCTKFLHSPVIHLDVQMMKTINGLVVFEILVVADLNVAIKMSKGCIKTF